MLGPTAVHTCGSAGDGAICPACFEAGRAHGRLEVTQAIARCVSDGMHDWWDVERCVLFIRGIKANLKRHQEERAALFYTWQRRLLQAMLPDRDWSTVEDSLLVMFAIDDAAKLRNALRAAEGARATPVR